MTQEQNNQDMRIKINDKIYRLEEIESGVDSLVELVEEQKYKDGDFLHSDWDDENITILLAAYEIMKRSIG